MGTWNKPPNKSPWDKGTPPPDIDELLSNLQDKFKIGLPKKGGLSLIIVLAIVLWLATGIFIIDPEEQGVIKRFGEITDVVGPGPHYHLPSPIETVQIAPVTAIRRLEIGFRTIQIGPPAKYRRVLKESLMLTGDENIIDVQFIVQYRISDLENYLYTLTNPDETVKSAAESAMREVVGDTSVTKALTVGKGIIEDSTASLLQQTMNSYYSGIKIENVKLQDVHPPDEVKDAFKDVVSAREDREKMINDAEGYRNNLVPKARGEAAQLINNAKAYAKEKVLVATGESERFNLVYEEYNKAKDITRERIMLETMASVLPKVNKVIADKKLGGNMLPFLPLNQVINQPNK
ncbi:MAG: FtsH protease activity modulator HflK [SAR324 cluster bacterium]|nr:FtsH protease activity modulator HflK [SAR324 cluster bacterium]MBL7035073.1 FtsH protease activity modulator HflK [SAR324 cluster bacterium]